MTAGSRVVVVDDSAMMRSAVIDALGGVRGVTVVGEAATGPEAIEAIASLRPDLVSLDIELPGFDGLEVLTRVMQRHPTKVILVSSYTTAGAETTLEGLARGAVDFVPKPSASEGIGIFNARMRRAFRSAQAAKTPVRPQANQPADSATADLRSARLAVIASSTGGPGALQQFFSAFATAPPIPMVVVQHMPPDFTRQMASRLDRIGPVRVAEAAAGDRLESGAALVAPGSAHVEITDGGVELSAEAPIGGLRPRADVTMRSAAHHYGADTVGVVMTGMGTDGLIGCREIRQAGGQVLAQDGPSSTVDGMPSAVRRAGLADHVGPPEAMARLLAAAAATTFGRSVPSLRSN
jgi:two-component system chemotaxis response regulator CheB